MLVVSELIDRVDIKKLLVCIAGGQLLFLLLATVTDEWSLVFVFVGLMLCTYAQIPVNDWLIAATYAYTEEFVLMYFILAGGMGLALLSALMMPSSSKRKTDSTTLVKQ